MNTVAIQPRFVAKDAAAQLLAMSIKTFERCVQKGEIPKPRQLSAGRVGWLVSELDEWAQSRPVSEILPPANTGAKKPRSHQACAA